MNEENYLILIKKQDLTTKVSSFEYSGSKVRVRFHKSETEYEYHLNHVLILENPQTIVLTEDMAVFNEGHPLFKIKHIQDFGLKLRVCFESGYKKVYDDSQLQIKSNGLNSADAQNIMFYFRAVSKHVPGFDDDEVGGSFLSKEYKRLNFVHSDSVLNAYLHASPIVKNDLGVTNYIFPFRYNLSQREALKQALNNTISVIEGPPGTGKTQTILNILANLIVMQNKTVAVVSGNNAAVENVREKLEREGYHFLVAGLGNTDNKKLFFTNPPHRHVGEWESDEPEANIMLRIAELDQKIQHLMVIDRELAALKQKLSTYQLEQEHFEHYYSKEDVPQLGKLSIYRQTPERILEFMKDSYLSAELGKDRKLLHKFKLFFKHGIINLKLLENHGFDVILTYQRQFYMLRVAELQQQITALEQELKSFSYSVLLKEHHKYSEKLFRHKLHNKYAHRPSKVYSMETYKLGKEFCSFIEDYPIVLSTTHSLRNSIPTNYLFDYCIIDEASQVDLLTGALAFSCCRQAIIVGDTKQLPQIVDLQIKREMDGEMLAGIRDPYNYFQHNILSSILALYGDDLPKTMLREHYRCHPQIIEFCNRKYYDEKLITFTKSDETDDAPLLIYKIVEGNHMRDGKRGKFNQRELDVIEQEVLLGLTNQIVLPDDIGVVTPYRHQADRAFRQFDGTIESDTIHKYQGREKPVIIMSTVLDKSKFGKMGMKFVNDPCKINVAISRAQKQFILVTAGEVFENYGNEVGDLIRYMEYSTLDSNIVESEITSIFDLLYQEYSDKLKAFHERAGVFRGSRYKSENLMHTLLHQVLEELRYSDFKLANQVLLMNLFPDSNDLDEEERRFIRNRSSVDFVIYYKFDNSPVLAIEVDGFAFHENNPEQLERDTKKDRIFKKKGLDLQRFPTTASGEEARIRAWFDQYLSSRMKEAKE